MGAISCWLLTFVLTLLLGLHCVLVESKAAAYLRDKMFDSYDDNVETKVGTFYVDYDADVNIPGRFQPKLPYRVPYLEQQSPYPQAYNSKVMPSVRRTSHGDILRRDVKDSYSSRYLFDNISDLPQGDSRISPGKPYFDEAIPRNLTVQTGKTAVLACKVRNRDQKSVSWIRLHDLHILTVDKYKYSTDERVSVLYNEVNKEWVLRILGVRHSDAGRYECQLSTKPVISYVITLHVIVPKAYISNSPDIYVHSGSLINLTCVVNHGTDQPVYIFWHHFGKMVDLGDRRRTLDVYTNDVGKTVSRLYVKKASLQDSGRYSCKPSNGVQDYVVLHILNEELQQAAMQTNSAQDIKLTYSNGMNVFSLILLTPFFSLLI